MPLGHSTSRAIALCRSSVATTLRRQRRRRRFQQQQQQQHRASSSSSSSSSGTQQPQQQDEIIKELLAKIEKDPQLFGKVWHLASTQVRHEMTKPILANLSTAVGRQEFNKADKNDDGVLDAVEFEHWLTKTLKRTAIAKPSSAAPTSADSGTTAAATPAAVSTDQLRKLAIVSAIPFVGFGFLDNAIMICSGSQIDAAFSSFGLSAMAAAALGNTVSDVAGIQAGGMIEAAASKLGLPDPKLNLAQLKAPIVKRVQIVASAVGIVIGCLLGMIPLLFMHHDEDRDLHRIFNGIDTNKSGTIDYSELVAALQKMGLTVSDVNADTLRSKFHHIASQDKKDDRSDDKLAHKDDGRDMVIDFAQFQKIVREYEKQSQGKLGTTKTAVQESD